MPFFLHPSISRLLNLIADGYVGSSFFFLVLKKVVYFVLKHEKNWIDELIAQAIRSMLVHRQSVKYPSVRLIID
jgi:hypothetical protein